MAAALPAPAGPVGAYSAAQAHALLAREMQGADIKETPIIHQEVKNMMDQMSSATLKTLARQIMEISLEAFPDGYVAAGFAAGCEFLLKQHTMNLIHYAMPPDSRFDFDCDTDFNWQAFRDHIFDLAAAKAAAAAALPVGAGTGNAGPTCHRAVEDLGLSFQVGQRAERCQVRPGRLRLRQATPACG